MKTSEKLYHINRNLSVLIARREVLSPTELEDLNLKIGEIIKEVRKLEK